MNTTHRPESTAAALYVAIELSAKEWLLTMSPAPDAPRQRVRVRAGDREAIVEALRRAKARFTLAAEAPVRSCCEAGRDGFWPHRLLTTLGITNLVVDSSSIEVSRRARRAKTDRLDGEKLLRMLLRYWGGERELWHVVHVPSADAEDARQASRGLTTLAAERTRYRNRIHSLLATHGVRRLRIDGRLAERLAAATDWAGVPMPPGVQARILATWRVLQAIETERQQARRLERQAVRAVRPTTCAQRLAQLRGVAARSATILAEELFGRGLRNRREVGALTGLVSAPYRSGTIAWDQGVTRGGLPAVRRVAVEIAWAWLRYQPSSALTQWYHRRFGGGGAVARRIGIVALARRVIIALWRYAEHGVVPEGALLKT
ncbi:MAG TPA: transposase [Vicinamibacterales bacterium]|nr:transposase [Vicinamibacterales bacterium]